MREFIFEINGQVISKENIDAWELTRLKKEYHFLKKHHFHFSTQLPTYLRNGDLDAARLELGKLKASYDPETFRTLLKKKYQLGNFTSKIAARLSRGRKYSITDFVIPNTTKSPEEVMHAIENIMLENTDTHKYMNLATNPDHFVLISTAPNVQEVLEITDGLRFRALVEFPSILPNYMIKNINTI